MIESKTQLIEDFRNKAHAFITEPGLTKGIDFDDAAVTLKRYVLSELHDQKLASLLARFQKPIRALDTATLGELMRQVEERLKD